MTPHSDGQVGETVQHAPYWVTAVRVLLWVLSPVIYAVRGAAYMFGSGDR